MKKNFNLALILVILFLSFISLYNVFYPGIYTAHDIWHNLARLNYYFQSIKDGQLPPYFLSNLAYGFGYPLFLFSYHLPWIIGSFFMFLGIDDVNAIKILFFLSFFLSGVSMYFLSWEISKNRFVSLISSVLYLWAPYRFFIIYVSAAVGVSFTSVFVPLVVLGLMRVLDNKIGQGITITAFGLSGLILSHFPTLIVFVPLFFLISFCLFLSCSSKFVFIKSLVLSVILGFGLSSFYFVPAIYYRNIILGLPDIYNMGFVSLKQLVYSKWGFGIIVNSTSENPFSFQIGIAQWFIIFLSILFFVFNKISSRRDLVAVLIISFFFNIFFSTSLSAFFWKNFFAVAGVDFPFRFIYPNVFISGLLFSFLAKSLSSSFFFRLTALFILFIAFYGNRNHIHPNMFLVENDFRAFVESETTTSTYDEYLPKYVDRGVVSKVSGERIKGSYGLNLILENTRESIYKIVNESEKEVYLPKVYYPFLEVYIDSVYSDFFKGNGGLIKVFIPDGASEVRIAFNRNGIISFSIFLSLVSLFVFLLLIWKNIFIKNRL